MSTDHNSLATRIEREYHAITAQQQEEAKDEPLTYTSLHLTITYTTSPEGRLTLLAYGSATDSQDAQYDDTPEGRRQLEDTILAHLTRLTEGS